MAQPQQALDTPERRAFYAKIDKSNMTALWTVMSALITPEPKSACVPFGWKFSDIREAMLEAGKLITAKEAERRVLILENPGMRGQSKITTSLYCGVQLVMPNEVAPAHRHSQSALRFVLEGSGAYTAVNGERTRMYVGDFVITPSGAWHDHGNQTDQPMFWIDGLDIPLIQFLDASFVEHLDADEQPVTKPEGDALARYGANMAPVGRVKSGATSPIFNYPYARSREALEQMRRTGEWDACHGLKMRYINPETGDHAMPTMGTFLQLLPKGFATARYRATDATVFSCVEGRGRTTIGDTVIEWGPKDIFVAPSWKPVVHEAAEDSVLFSFSDQPVQQKLGVWREDRGNA
ncbi:MAG TPA: gentisate 1,2-dioxygenase [Hyphomicrobiaceae bacterium]|nr:gentisate 1,2-dioxygenase [Hyphomicrobiaceae bacterium]